MQCRITVLVCRIDPRSMRDQQTDHKLAILFGRCKHQWLHALIVRQRQIGTRFD